MFDGAESIRNTIEKDTAHSKEEALSTFTASCDLVSPPRWSRPGPDPDTFPQPQALRPDQGRSLQGRPEVPGGHPDRYGPRALRCCATRTSSTPSSTWWPSTPARPTMRHPSGVEVDVNTDDIDHFGNRRIRTVGELVQNQVRVGLTRLERVVKERMTTQDPDAITPQSLINIRPVTASIKEFFGTSQLSQFMDQPNPLAGLTHRRRLSALGPGGLSLTGRVRGPGRPPLPLRADVPDRDPGGPQHRPDRLAGHLRPGQRFGFIETPYRKVEAGRVTTKVEYLTAIEEERTSSPRPMPPSKRTAIPEPPGPGS